MRKIVFWVRLFLCGWVDVHEYFLDEFKAMIKYDAVPSTNGTN